MKPTVFNYYRDNIWTFKWCTSSHSRLILAQLLHRQLFWNSSTQLDMPRSVNLIKKTVANFSFTWKVHLKERLVLTEILIVWVWIGLENCRLERLHWFKIYVLWCVYHFLTETMNDNLKIVISQHRPYWNCREQQHSRYICNPKTHWKRIKLVTRWTWIRLTSSDSIHPHTMLSIILCAGKRGNKSCEDST